MDKFGIIGWPVAHSQSPRLFASAYGGRWPYDLIGAPTFEECWLRFLDGGYRAINVTAPYKVDAFLKADIRAESAVRVGAANIIVRTPEGLAAHNSDYLGVRSILSSLPGIRTVCVVGFGGAGKAALAAAQDCGLETFLLRHDGSGYVLPESGVAGRSGRELPPENVSLRSTLPSHQAGPLPLPVPRAARFSGGTPAGNQRAEAVLPAADGSRNRKIFWGGSSTPSAACSGGQATAGNRPASLDPTVRFAPGPPSYDAEGGTDFRRFLPTGNGPDVIIYTLPRKVDWIRRMRCRYLLEANYKDPCLKNSPIASEYIPGERWLLEQARCGFPLMTGELPNGQFFG